MSSVTNPGTRWYFWATPERTSDIRKKRKVKLHADVQFHANLHTHEQTFKCSTKSFRELLIRSDKQNNDTI